MITCDLSNDDNDDGEIRQLQISNRISLLPICLLVYNTYTHTYTHVHIQKQIYTIYQTVKIVHITLLFNFLTIWCIQCLTLTCIRINHSCKLCAFLFLD